MNAKLILFFLLFCPKLINGQEPYRLSFNHLTTEQGLSNNNVFYMHRDSRGYLWLASVNGLNRYDGQKVKVYKQYNSGIKGDRIKKIVEDKDGNLWIGSTEGLNFYNRKLDIITAVNSPENDKAFSGYPHAIDNKGLLWLVITNTKGPKLYTYNIDSKQYTFITNQITDQFSVKQNTGFEPISTIYCGGQNDIGLRKLSFANNKLVKVDSFFTKPTDRLILKNIKEYVYVENDSTIWITGIALGLLKFNPNTNTFKKYNSYENRNVNNLTQIVSHKKYFLIGSNSGTYVFDRNLGKFVQLIKHNANKPDSPSINWNECVYKDYDDNLFLGFGVDFTNLNHNIAEHWLSLEAMYALQQPDNHISTFGHNGDFVWAKPQSGHLMLLNKHGNFLKKYIGYSYIFTDSKQRSWLSNSETFLLVNPYKNTENIVFVPTLSGKKGWQVDMAEINPDNFIITCAAGSFEYNLNNGTLSPITAINQLKATPVFPLYFDKPSQKLFVGANWWGQSHVFSKKNGIWKVEKSIFDLGPFAIRKSNKENELYLCTTKGLKTINTKTLQFTSKTEADGLPDNSVTDILEQKNGDYWLVTNKGISYYDKKLDTYKNYHKRDGAYSSEYGYGSAFEFSDGRVAFAGTDGISIFDPKLIKNYKVKPKIEISGLYINELLQTDTGNINEQKEITFKPNQNTFAFDLVGIEFGFPEKVKVKYKLEGFDKEWIMANGTATARYVNVGEGNYTFKAIATDVSGLLTSNIRILKVNVIAPIYKTTWFRGFLVASILLLGLFLYNFRLKQIREEIAKKEQIKRIKAEAEINALRSQMNPHFIFNCLNTVDSYILLNKSDEASDFLQKFSKLIRLILENSRQEFVVLKDEIKTLELYISLEQERSGNAFTYKIDIDKNIEKNNWFVPSMIVQPFVENAILHGLRHGNQPTKHLSLKMAAQKNILEIVISDNGIGRTAANEINKSNKINKQSVGIKVTEERIEKLNELYPNTASIIITDLDKPKGTRINIDLPFLTINQLEK